MEQSVSQIYMHLVFSTKNRVPFFKNSDIREQLYSYIAKIIYENDSYPICIGGYEDHIHIFFNLSKNVCFKDIIGEIKRSTSKWIKTKGDEYTNFYWQAGYGGFSVGQQQKQKTINYINKQNEHHKKVSFQEELRMFMTKNNMEIDERYFWD
jgi:REP element-mobilizing transposase RayT